MICRHYLPRQKELSRKIVHIGTGPVILLAWILEISARVAIPVASVITVGLLINHQLRFVPALEDVNRQSYGTIAYGLSITILLIFLWPENAAAVSAGVLAMSFGDGFAGLIGRQVNSPTWRVLNQQKSIAGTVSMGVITAMALLLIMILSGSFMHPLLIVAISTLAVGLEQVGPWGIDNLTVPIGVAYSWLLFSS